MTMDGLAVFGAGNLAACILDAVEAADMKLWGFADRAPEDGTNLRGYPVVSEDALLSGSLGIPSGVIVAVGDNWERARIVEKVEQKMGRVPFPALIHPAAHVSKSARVDEGSVILAGAVVHSEAVVGRHVSIWSNAVVEHNCAVADFVSLAPGAILAGNVKVGERSFLGTGSSVSHEVSIGADVIVGTGAAVINDLPGEAVYVGCPARRLRARKPGDRYL